jgi:AraC-like DNA-binding protein
MHGRRLRDSAEFEWRKQLTLEAYLGVEVAFAEWALALFRALSECGARPTSPIPNDDRLAQALEILDHSLAGGFPVDALEQCCGLSLGQLNRMAKSSSGRTLHAYWESRRAIVARKALTEPGARIKAVAADLGFQDLAHFSAWFKRHHRASPRDWMRLQSTASRKQRPPLDFRK